jgi:hypothetical protein
MLRTIKRQIERQESAVSRTSFISCEEKILRSVFHDLPHCDTGTNSTEDSSDIPLRNALGPENYERGIESVSERY